tara:strand:- start:202 stop:441 length:240 start_codon:yes stop_codon:yes gene_type:complete
MVMIFQPKGRGTEHKEGTILVQATFAAGTGIPGDASVGWYGSDYTIDSSISGLATGAIDGIYNDRFTGCAPCFSQCGPC